MLDGHCSKVNILEVGSGNAPRGDLYLSLNTISPKKANNFVLAEAMYLPFGDEPFNSVFSASIIELVKGLFLFLKEMHQVARKKIIVQYKYRWGNKARTTLNINYFDEGLFQKTSDSFGMYEWCGVSKPSLYNSSKKCQSKLLGASNGHKQPDYIGSRIILKELD